MMSSRQRDDAARDEEQAEHPCAEHDEIAAAVGPRIQNSADAAGAELFPVKVLVGLVVGTVDAGEGVENFQLEEAGEDLGNCRQIAGLSPAARSPDAPAGAFPSASGTPPSAH